MKRKLKKQLLEGCELLGKANDCIHSSLKKGAINDAVQFMEECKNAADAIKKEVDEDTGRWTETASALQGYCRLIDRFQQQAIGGESLNLVEFHQSLARYSKKIFNRLKREIITEREVVFLPYKASMWDSLETVWKKAVETPNTNAVVIPIPFYERNADGSFGKFHYEGNLFPEYVPIVHYDDYDFEGMHPDEIYIHNPYDDANLVTSVAPFFYSRNLKQFTDKLIYIPYFVIEEFDIHNKKALENRQHFAQVPAVIYADEIIVQSETIKQLYVESIVKLTGEHTRKLFERKIKGTGSPKIEKIKSLHRDEVSVPQEWEPFLYKEDGQRKLVVLYNNSISTLLRESDRILAKMRNIFSVFDKYREDIAILWRPHPLIGATIRSMVPQLWEEYCALVEEYKAKHVGIYDDTVDLDRAIVISDVYYGDPSSLVTLCRAINMPVMIQNPAVLHGD